MYVMPMAAVVLPLALVVVVAVFLLPSMLATIVVKINPRPDLTESATVVGGRRISSVPCPRAVGRQVRRGIDARLPAVADGVGATIVGGIGGLADGNSGLDPPAGFVPHAQSALDLPGRPAQQVQLARLDLFGGAVSVLSHAIVAGRGIAMNVGQILYDPLAMVGGGRRVFVCRVRRGVFGQLEVVQFVVLFVVVHEELLGMMIAATRRRRDVVMMLCIV